MGSSVVKCIHVGDFFFFFFCSGLQSYLLDQPQTGVSKYNGKNKREEEVEGKWLNFVKLASLSPSPQTVPPYGFCTFLL